jgi:hypothetical protein
MLSTSGFTQIAVTPSEAISSRWAVRPARSPPWKVPFAERSTATSFEGSPFAKRSTRTK